jgi:hypothetical protein
MESILNSMAPVIDYKLPNFKYGLMLLHSGDLMPTVTGCCSYSALRCACMNKKIIESFQCPRLVVLSFCFSPPEHYLAKFEGY